MVTFTPRPYGATKEDTEYICGKLVTIRGKQISISEWGNFGLQLEATMRGKAFEVILKDFYDKWTATSKAADEPIQR